MKNSISLTNLFGFKYKIVLNLEIRQTSSQRLTKPSQALQCLSLQICILMREWSSRMSWRIISKKAHRRPTTSLKLAHSIARSLLKSLRTDYPQLARKKLPPLRSLVSPSQCIIMPRKLWMNTCKVEMPHRHSRLSL